MTAPQPQHASTSHAAQPRPTSPFLSTSSWHTTPLPWRASENLPAKFEDLMPLDPNHINHRNAAMPFFYSKPIGGRNFGTSVHADRHGVRRGPWRFRIGRFHCFR
ncbi:hypothetical protein CGRA01v4_06365 [Colletotrichum graminicola]|nr:hypothetical protein CGRA01v4_06365 [Colletotrichum graminicola]